MTERNHYKTLQLDQTASKVDIENSYHKLSNLYHPDKNPEDRINAQRKFNDVN